MHPIVEHGWFNKAMPLEIDDDTVSIKGHESNQYVEIYYIFELKLKI